METILQEKLKITTDSDTNEPGSSICLRTPLIIRQIMENFSNKELLATLSFVNKLWNYEARRLLNYRGRLIAILKSCEDLEAFASDVGQMNFFPFSGVGISINEFKHPATCHPSPTGALDPIHHELCNQLPWKSVYLCAGQKWEITRNCPGFLFVTKGLKDNCKTIERLSILLRSPGEELVLQLIQNLEFPSLKTLKIWGCINSQNYNDHTNFYKAFVSRAPNLEEIYPDDDISRLKGHLLEGSSAVFCVRTFNPLYHNLCEGSLSALRLQRMDLKTVRDDAIVKKFHRVIPKVLQTSRFALKSLNIDSVFLLQLMRYRICLENLQSLEISTHHEALGPLQLQVLDLLKKFDFTRIFPQLSGVSLYNINESSKLSSAQISDFIEGCDALQEPMPDRAVNMKFLSLYQSLQEFEAPFLSAVFPCVETLYICAGDGFEVYEQIWKHWMHLKDLTVRSYFTRRWLHETQSANFDSAFCGIFPEEVAQLRKKDDEYLKAVHIVPVAPSVTCVKNTWTVNLLLEGRADEPIEELFAENLQSTFVFSKVTGLIAFARCPNLSVNLKTYSYQVERELSHMKRYAQVILDRSEVRSLASSQGRSGRRRVT